MPIADPALAFDVASQTNFNIPAKTNPVCPDKDHSIVKSVKKGIDVLNDPFFNKGGAFSSEERTSLHLWGKLPPKIATIEEQIAKVQNIFEVTPPGIAQYRFAMNVASTNVTLFYAWVQKHFESVAPAIYTPAVGDACLEYGKAIQPLRGIYLTPEFKGLFDKVIQSWHEEDVDAVVLTDGGRILGLGDLGVHGMPIPCGKLMLYVGIGGIRPERTLPIVIDVGTSSRQRESGSYQGWNHDRLGGREYYELVDELILAIKTRWPHCLIQFEDFSSSQAWILLNAYKEKVLCFNDDIQGTGAVVAAGIFNAMRIIEKNQKKPIKDLFRSGKFVIVGGGSAGYGVCLAVKGMILENTDITEEEASNNLFVMDTKGVLTVERAIGDKKPLEFAAKDLSNTSQSMGVTKDDKLLDVIRKVKPICIIGLTGIPHMFSEDVVREMSIINEEPIIFPLSNPTTKAECTFSDALNWSQGRCIFGSGSPFDPVNYRGDLKKCSQMNNMLIFPGIGLSAILSRARGISSRMFAIASKVLAYSVCERELVSSRCLFPGLNKARDISCSIALEVMREMNASGYSQISPDEQKKLSLEYVRERMYDPVYPKISPQ